MQGTDLLFSPLVAGRLRLRNRFMRSATAERLCRADGTPGPELAEVARRLAAGGVGLVVMGHTFVRPDGKASVGMSGLWRDDQIPAFAAVAAAAHEHGAAVALQLNHGGRQASPHLTGSELVAPSAVPLEPGSPVPRALSEGEIWQLIDAYAQAARRARDAGFDAVQLHAAHGYLISQFLSPHANRRTDAWGGTVEKRARFLWEVARAVRALVGNDYPVLIKLGLADFIPGGLTLEEGLQVVGLASSMDLDLLEISGGAGPGNTRSNINKEEQEAYFLPWALAARQRTALPIALVGGIRSLKVMCRVVQSGAVDVISMSRPFIREPGLVQAIASGAQDRARCISCSLCSTRADVPTRCWVE
jgi:2,4-dienoyl-CoA reductase-like NADH-dependent reductase (Old Yellow Enzyme family)